MVSRLLVGNYCDIFGWLYYGPTGDWGCHSGIRTVYLSKRYGFTNRQRDRVCSAV